MMSESEFRDERVSFDEIIVALKDLQYEVLGLGSISRGNWRVLNVEFVARKIVEHVHANREPEYIPGEIYQDAMGRKLLRRDNDLYPWWQLTGNAAGAYGEYPFPRLHVFPERPIRKLVPIDEAEIHCTLPHEPEGA